MKLVLRKPEEKEVLDAVQIVNKNDPALRHLLVTNK